MDRGCLAVDGQAVKLPDKGETLEFKNHVRKFKTPYVIYADFECLTSKTGCYSKPLGANEIDDRKAFTRKYQEHVPTGFQLLLVDDKRKITRTEIYRGEDCMNKFSENLHLI